jgi:phage portal protein BeeE
VANKDLHEMFWNEMLARLGRRPGILSTDQELDEEQAKELSDSFTAKYGGAANAGRVPVLGQGVKWQDNGLTLKELEWLESRKANAREIGGLFHVPPIFMGDFDVSEFKVEVQEGMLWKNAILPVLRRMKLMLDSQYLPMWGDDLAADWNLDAIEEVARANETRALIDASYLDRKVQSRAEVRKRTFGLPAYVDSDIVYGPLTDTPIGRTSDLVQEQSPRQSVGEVRGLVAELRRRQRGQRESQTKEDD